MKKIGNGKEKKGKIFIFPLKLSRFEVYIEKAPLPAQADGAV